MWPKLYGISANIIMKQANRAELHSKPWWPIEYTFISFYMVSQLFTKEHTKTDLHEKSLKQKEFVMKHINFILIFFNSYIFMQQTHGNGD